MDPTTVSDRLMEMNAPEEITSGDFLRNLIMYASTSEGIDDHIEIVQKKSLLRRMIKISRDIEDRCFSDTGEASDILEEAEKKVFEITSSRTSGDYVPIRQIVKTAVEKPVDELRK